MQYANLSFERFLFFQQKLQLRRRHQQSFPNLEEESVLNVRSEEDFSPKPISPAQKHVGCDRFL